MPDRMTKGSVSPLHVTKEAQHRIFIGLGWDPHLHTTLKERIGNVLARKQHHHDLDLACYAYDANYNLVEVVSADTREAATQSGKIYHSGDNVEGIGDGDDEQISVELKDLDDYIVHLLFTVRIKSGHKFGEIKDPQVRLVDGYSNRVFLEHSLSAPEGNDKSGYAFVHLFWTAESWQMRLVDEYFDTITTKDLDALIKRA